MTGQLLIETMTQDPTAQRWQRRKGSRPSEVLDAALSEFFEKGFEAARLEDIAARAGVSKGTIYLYFSSKEEVFEALVNSIPQANIEDLERLLSDPELSPEIQLDRFLRLLGAAIRDERMIKFPRLIISAAGRFPHLADIYRREVVTRAVSVLSSIIERGVQSGAFRAVDPQQAAFAAVAPLLFIAIWRTTFERPQDEVIDAESFVLQHIQTLVRGLRKDGQS